MTDQAKRGEPEGILGKTLTGTGGDLTPGGEEHDVEGHSLPGQDAVAPRDEAAEGDGPQPEGLRRL
jgi:hypothetical protein